MNLIEARKAAHEGWVRSPTRTKGIWCRITGGLNAMDCGNSPPSAIIRDDLDAEDWEPKPREVFEAEVWVSFSGVINQVSETVRDDQSYLKTGWRKIRVREVT